MGENMKKRFLNLKLISLLFVCLLALLLVLLPKPCSLGAAKGLLLCGRIIIPSLFPFTFCVIFINKSGVFEKLHYLTPITQLLFGLDSYLFSVFLLSLIGGYPLGAKLINEAVRDGKISAKKGKRALSYCINAGPAFLLSAIGSGILGSYKLGLILLFSNILGSIAICEFCRFLNVEDDCKPYYAPKKKALSDCFVISVAEASEAVLKICGFVILFSVIGTYVSLFQKNLPHLQIVSMLLEVTTAVTMTKNIFVIAFLTGFGGISIWCQVLSLCNAFKTNFLSLLAARTAHGAISSAFVFLLLKLFRLKLPTMIAGNGFPAEILYSTPALTAAVLLTAIVFVISVTAGNLRGKLLDEFC